MPGSPPGGPPGPPGPPRVAAAAATAFSPRNTKKEATDLLGNPCEGSCTIAKPNSSTPSWRPSRSAPGIQDGIFQ
eukprot:8618748-Ditylum_brightwellii.AAC.1